MMRLLFKPTSYTCLAAITALARPVHGFSSPSLPVKAFVTCSQRASVSNLQSVYSSIIRSSIDRRNLAASNDSLQLRMSSSADSSSSKGLYLFDFDGVVCDSCDECTVSAWRTCKILDAIKIDEDISSDHPPQWLFDKMREIRPAIEVGWQIPVLLSVFLEQKANATPESPAMSVPDIIDNYEALVEQWLQVHNLQGSDMIKTFGQVRDDWIANDLNSWLDINTFYSGISQGITDCKGESVLVTTKQHRFADALVRHAGIGEAALPTDSVYGLGMYKSKSDVIVDRMLKGGYEASNTHFFEDRWPTIAKCLKDDRLEGVKFYLCSWGYCTEGELNLAHDEPRVEVLGLKDFGKVVAH